MAASTHDRLSFRMKAVCGPTPRGGRGPEPAARDWTPAFARVAGERRVRASALYRPRTTSHPTAASG